MLPGCGISLHRTGNRKQTAGGAGAPTALPPALKVRLMYMARVHHNRSIRYLLRESYAKKGVLFSRDIFDLGDDPTDYIVYPGGSAFYFSEDLEDALMAAGYRSPFDELDDLFWPFLKPEIRRVLGHFHHRRRDAATPKPSTRAVHTFDKRRFYYLKCGRTDVTAIGNVPEKFFNRLHHQSRDEMEQHFIQWELILKPHERRQYVYACFNLQRHFTSPMATRFPSAMDPEEMDAHFIDDLCRLHGDTAFWEGFSLDDELHPYLARYAVMYFDNPFPRRDFMRDYVREFIDSRRYFRFPEHTPQMAKQEISSRLGVSETELQSMSKKALTRHFRQIALSAHPDHGGSHEKFIKIAEAYQAALHKLK
jgi:hypothetical protein